MKAIKFVTAALVASVMLATVAEAGSIGRSGGGGFSGGSRSSSSSFSRPSSTYSAPSKSAPTPSVAPAPAKSGGIGSTQGSVGVRKSEVTNGVRNDVATSNPNAAKAGSYSAPSTSPSYAPAPSYGYAPAPAPQVTNGSTFMSSLGGSFLGSWIGSSLGHSGHGGTTVINNGTAGVPNSGGVVTQVDGSGQVTQSAPVAQQSSGGGMGSIIWNVILFAVLIAVIVGIALLFYKGFKMLMEYINKERGVSNIPFNPTQRFWEIQKAFASADVAVLNSLLGPDIVDELTNGLQPSTLTLHNVSHEIRLSNKNEFSIWYKFEDDGSEVNQVWHYERFGSDWRLNGIENV